MKHCKKHCDCHFHCFTHNFLTQQRNRFISTAANKLLSKKKHSIFHVLNGFEDWRFWFVAYNLPFIVEIHLSCFHSVSCPFICPRIYHHSHIEYIECQHGWWWTQRKNSDSCLFTIPFNHFRVCRKQQTISFVSLYFLFFFFRSSSPFFSMATVSLHSYEFSAFHPKIAFAS